MKKVDEKFVYQNIKLIVVRCNGCEPCFFCNMESFGCTKLLGNNDLICSSNEREDNISVIFKKVELYKYGK
jgi:hypothetical protein